MKTFMLQSWHNQHCNVWDICCFQKKKLSNPHSKVWVSILKFIKMGGTLAPGLSG